MPLFQSELIQFYKIYLSCVLYCLNLYPQIQYWYYSISDLPIKLSDYENFKLPNYRHDIH